jgi:acyl dehydratase
MRFAGESDPQPFHRDDNVGPATTLFCGLVAGGWHTAGTMMRLTVIVGGIVGSGGECYARIPCAWR